MESTKRCPLCGEVILRIAVRCKHCRADLHPFEPAEAHEPPADTAPPVSFPHPGEDLPLHDPFAPFGPEAAWGSRLAEYQAPEQGTFEQRFLDFAFKTTVPISGASVAYALKIPIDEATDGLEDLAARDVLVREVDHRGFVFFQLPGRPQSPGGLRLGAGATALSPYAHPPASLYDPPSLSLTGRIPTETAALWGLLVNVLFLPGLGSLIGGKTGAGVFQLLMFLLGIPLCFVVVGAPMVIGAWIWALVTGVNMLTEAKQQSAQQLSG